jgi:hypothetical protein
MPGFALTTVCVVVIAVYGLWPDAMRLTLDCLPTTTAALMRNPADRGARFAAASQGGQTALPVRWLAQLDRVAKNPDHVAAPFFAVATPLLRTPLQWLADTIEVAAVDASGAVTLDIVQHEASALKDPATVASPFGAAKQRVSFRVAVSSDVTKDKLFPVPATAAAEPERRGRSFVGSQSHNTKDAGGRDADDVNVFSFAEGDDVLPAVEAAMRELFKDGAAAARIGDTVTVRASAAAAFGVRGFWKWRVLPGEAVLLQCTISGGTRGPTTA